MDHQALAAHLNLLKWRDDQFEATTDQLEAALPELLNSVSGLVDDAGTIEFLKSSLFMRKAVAGHISAWAAEQARIAARRAEIALDETISELGANFRQEGALREIALAGFGTTSGLSMIGGSLLAIPALVGAATVNTGGFLGFFAVSTISVPVMVAGLTGVGLLSLAGSAVVKRTWKSTRSKLRARLLEAVEQHVMGYGCAAVERTVLSDIQAMIVLGAQKKIAAIS